MSARSELRAARGAAARRSGRSAEVLAALWLMAKGYRVLGFRLRTPQGEIDLLVLHGRVLAAVEVKRRRTRQEALDAVTHIQRERIVRAVTAIAARRASLADREIRLDLFALAPGVRPCHIVNAWGDCGGRP